MHTNFIHLENALKRANEFIEVGNNLRALELLCDVLHNKRHRAWQKNHIEIMSKYLELCVESKQSYAAKEGIYQYKIICQQSFISSFEDAIRQYISLAEQKAQAAKGLSQDNIEDIDDLENVQTPEDILMSAVSNECNQDRKDRVILIPWVKFLWESYRQCLDILRHNSRTEALYHDIARRAFNFCVEFNRKSEFRKLCDILHLHLDQLKRSHSHNNQMTFINLNDPETQTLHLETRLLQLDLAIQMELWQEAYRATDDIKKFNLMGSGKKGLGKPGLIASYYQKLALVFWKANSPLFHATALFRLFHLNKDLRKNFKHEEAQKMANRLVVATLAIPIPAIRPDIDKIIDTEENVIDQHHRNLSTLLGIVTKPPTRASLIKDLQRMGVLQHVCQPIQDLYNLLEADFNPLGICGRVQEYIEFLEKSVAEEAQIPEILQYIPALKELTVIRLFREVSQVYRTIEFSRLFELCPFVDRVGLERLMVESARRHDLQVRIDHRQKCFIFGNDLCLTAGEEYVEGPHLQSMPNERMRRQLVSMYSSLQKAVNLIEPSAVSEKRENMKRSIMRTYFQNASLERDKILARHEIIEQRKQLINRMGAQREEDERRKAEEQAAKLREAEEARLQEENRQRERLRRENEENELRKQMNKDQLLRMKQVIPDLKLDDLNDDELAKLKPQDVQRKRVEQLEKERRQSLAKQRKVERKLDHFERAKRLEEIPLIKAVYEEFKVKDVQVWDEFQKSRIEAIKQERELALRQRDRFMRLMGDKEKFIERVMETRKNEYEQRLREFENVIKDERKKRLEMRRQKRNDERRVKYNKEKEAKRLALAESMKRKKEEELAARRAREAEERARIRKELEQGAKPAEDSLASSRRRAPDNIPLGPSSSHAPPPPISTESSNWRERPWRNFNDERKPYSGRRSDNREPYRYGGRNSGPRDGPPGESRTSSNSSRNSSRNGTPRDSPQNDFRDFSHPQSSESNWRSRKAESSLRDSAQQSNNWRTEQQAVPHDKVQDDEAEGWNKIDRRGYRNNRSDPPSNIQNRNYGGRSSDRGERPSRKEPPPIKRPSSRW